MSESREIEGLRKGLESHLRIHGHAFQYAALAEARRVFNENKSPWRFEASEFPVEVQGAGTRIDIILWIHNSPYWMLAECKRANPALKNWCFLRAPAVRRGDGQERYLAEVVDLDRNKTTTLPGNELEARCLRLRPFYDSDAVAHLSVELKSDEKGEGPGRGQVDEAADQIMRGMNGLAELVRSNNNLLGPTGARIFLPVIFTTARLFMCDADLSQTDVLTGNITLASSNFTEVDWVFLQHPVSSSFQHRIYNPHPETLAEQLETEFLRTIPIVTAKAIAKFLSVMNRESFSPEFPPCYEAAEKREGAQ